jgi:hypothetical protein
LWSIAKFDLGLTWEEFAELTPSMFKALRKRQEIQFRHTCLAVAINAADYRNAHRQDSGDRLWSPLDFIVAENEQNPEREQVKQNIASAFGMLMSMRKPISPKERQPLTVEEMKTWRKKIVRDLISQGWSVEEADAIFDESLSRE